jgi:hypothetical protein
VRYVKRKKAVKGFKRRRAERISEWSKASRERKPKGKAASREVKKFLEEVKPVFMIIEALESLERVEVKSSLISPALYKSHDTNCDTSCSVRSCQIFSQPPACFADKMRKTTL